MCTPDDPHDHSRRDVLKTAALSGAAALGAALPGPALAQAQGQPGAPPPDTGMAGRRTLIRGGAVLSLDPAVGDFAAADVLLEGSRIAAVGPSLEAGDAAAIDAAGMIVMPGYDAPCRLGRELGVPIAAHVLGNFGIPEPFDRLIAEGESGESGSDHVFRWPGPARSRELTPLARATAAPSLR